MSVELRNHSTFGDSSSSFLEPDCVIKLQHEWRRDRIKRINFDRVEQVIVWRSPAILRLAVSGIALGGLSTPFLAMGRQEGVIPAVILLGLMLGFWAYYLYMGKTTIQIIRLGKTQEISGIYSPGKVRQFVEEMTANIRATQAAQARPEAMGVTVQGVETVKTVEPPMKITLSAADLMMDVPVTVEDVVVEGVLAEEKPETGEEGSDGSVQSTNQDPIR